MTYFSAVLSEVEFPKQVMMQTPEPLPPEELLKALSQQAPVGEYSADAF